MSSMSNEERKLEVANGGSSESFEEAKLLVYTIEEDECPPRATKSESSKLLLEEAAKAWRKQRKLEVAKKYFTNFLIVLK